MDAEHHPSHHPHHHHGGRGKDRPFLVRYLAARPTIQRTVALACLAAFVIAAAALLADAFDKASTDHQFAVDARSRELSTYQALIASRISQATSLAQAVGGFGSGYAAPRYIDHDNGTRAERMQQGNETHWQAFASALIDNVPGVLALELQVSGIITHVYPPDPSAVGYDLLRSRTGAPSYKAFMHRATTTVIGPVELIGNNGIGFVTRFPVYLSPANRTYETFWGAGVALFQITDLFNALGLRERVQPGGYDLLVYAHRTSVEIENNETVSRRRVEVVYRTREDLKRDDICGGAHGQTAQVQLPTQDDMFVCLAPRGGVPSSSPSVCTIVARVAIALACSATLALLLYGAIAFGFSRRHRFVPHRKMISPGIDTRHTMVAIKNMAWWRENQDAATLQHALARFEAVVRSAAAKHRCYVAGRVAEGCFLVVAKDTADLLRFGQWCHQQLSDSIGDMKLVKRRRSRHEDDGVTPQVDIMSDTTSVTTRRRRSKRARFNVSCAAHYGPLEAEFDAEEDVVHFVGDGLVPCATAVDAAEPGELVCTDAVMMCVEAEKIGLEDVVRALARDVVDGVTLYIIGAASAAPEVVLDDKRSSPVRNPAAGDSNFPNSTAPDAQRPHTLDRTVLTAVSAASGSVLVKRVGLLSVELLIGQSDADVRLAAPRFAAALGRIAEAVAAMHASIIAVTGSRVVIACNALHTVSTLPALRILAVEEVVRLAAAGPDNIGVITVATCGTASVGQLPTGQVVCVGRCVTRLLKLAELAQELAERSFASADPAVTQRALVDAPMAEQVAPSYELQCVGPSFVLSRLAKFTAASPRLPSDIGGRILDDMAALTDPPTLLYSVDRAWPDAASAKGEPHDEAWLYRTDEMRLRSRFRQSNTALEAAFGGGDAESGSTLAREALAECDANSVLLRSVLAAIASISAHDTNRLTRIASGIGVASSDASGFTPVVP